jgi:putative heme-binding domain-containing protein
LVATSGLVADVRIEALKILAEKNAPGLIPRLSKLLLDNNPAVCREAFAVLMVLDRSTAIAEGITALKQDGSPKTEIISVSHRSDGRWSDLSMGEPTSDNLATAGTITWIDLFSAPHADAGADGMKLPRLNDGKLAANDDDISACTWFDQQDARWVLDLGSAVEIGRIDTYSSHKGDRAPMDIAVWGSKDEVMPDPSSLKGSWVKLGGGNTGNLGEGGKHALSLLNTMGSLGTYRWILWQSKRAGTNFTEVSVYPAGKTPTGLVRVVTDSDQRAWENLSMGAPDSQGLTVQGAIATAVAGYAQPADGTHDGGKLPRLFANEIQANDDDIAHSVWTDGGEARWLVDLQQSVNLARINTYSWHKEERAVQQFVLWMSDAAQAPDATAKNLAEVGWRRIATVDTKRNGDKGKHGSCIIGVDGPIGTARWLLWQHAERKTGTFVGRIDIFPTGVELPPIKRGVSAASVALKQQVLASFGALDDAQSAAALSEWLDLLMAGKALGAVQLELITAAGRRQEPALVAKLKAWRDGQDTKDPLAAYKISMYGGNPEKGENIFKFHLAQCIKCHSVNREGGNAGPDLAGVGRRLTTEKLLESLIVPSAEVVPGYGVATALLTDGTSVIGSLMKQDEKSTVIKLADGKEVTLAKETITQLTPPVSSMIPMGGILSPTELRDVMAYLKSLK